tara:strand:+ start:162 stop:416 length:255 start_codon:yes stop_codon:yes gene_type:complete
MFELVFASILATAVMQEVGINTPLSELMKKPDTKIEAKIVEKKKPTRSEKQIMLKKQITDVIESNSSLSDSKVETKVVWVFETK